MTSTVTFTPDPPTANTYTGEYAGYVIEGKATTPDRFRSRMYLALLSMKVEIYGPEDIEIFDEEGLFCWPEAPSDAYP